MIALWLTVSAWAAEPCTGPTRVDVLSSIDAAETAFADAKPEDIAAAAARARELVPCVGARLLPEEAAGIHRLFAYDTFVQRNLQGAQVWLEASRAADPGYAIPTRVLPARHPLRSLYDQALPQEREQELVPAGRGVQVWVDGQRTDRVPVGRPALVQLVSNDGVQTFLQSQGGAPEGLEAQPNAEILPLIRDAGMLAVGVAGTWVSPEGGSQTYGGPQVRVHLPLAGVLRGEGMVALPVTAASVDGERTVYGLPTAQLGIVGRVDGKVEPWVGAGALLLLDNDGVGIGGAGAVGLDVPLKPVGLATEMRLGWAGAPLVSVGAGVAFAL